LPHAVRSQGSENCCRYPNWVIRVVLTVRRSGPVYPNKQTIREPIGTSHSCQTCLSRCKKGRDGALLVTIKRRRAFQTLGQADSVIKELSAGRAEVLFFSDSVSAVGGRASENQPASVL
jgi:hypothetical protein